MKYNSLKIQMFFSIMVFAIVLLFSCKKDDDDTPNNNDNEIATLLVGTWYRESADLYQTISFEKNTLQGKDFFIDEDLTGAANFDYSFIAENEIEIVFLRTLGDYEPYNGFMPQTTINVTIEVSRDSLFITYNGQQSKYARLAEDDLLNQDLFLGSWENNGSGDRNILAFRKTLSSFGYGSEIYMDQSDSGAVNYTWDFNGDLVYISFENGHEFGDYFTYNETSQDGLLMARASVISNDEIAFSSGGATFTYNRMPSSDVTELDDLLGYWLSNSGTATEVLGFKIINEGGTGTASHFFVEGMQNGAANNMYWTVAGDLLCVETQNVFGDYENYTGLGLNESLVLEINHTGNEFTITTPGGNTTFTKMADGDVVSGNDLLGTWERIDGTYNGTLTFTDGTTPSSDSFTDGTQSGTAQLEWWVNGNLLTVQLSNFTGDYGVYNGSSEFDTTTGIVTLSGNTLTYTVDGVDYVYTKL